MTPEQWTRLKEAFQGALDQPAHVRRSWLAAACADNPTLLREAEALLDAHDTAGSFLEQPARIDPADLGVLLPGARLGAYEIVEEIGRGGMGVVYLAEDPRLGRRVALKLLPAIVAANAEMRERLRREARAAATISHPSVATVFALEDADDQLFIVSEHVRGETLRSAIERGPIDPLRARAIAAAVARALGAAHDAGVVHRDLKPENVLITPDGGVKVVDFGIAHAENAAAARLTRAGAMLGTPAYMAPEQLLGGAVDARADLYALGVVLAEMLTGRHPLHAGARSAAPPEDAAAGPYVDPLRGRLMSLAGRCMQPDPAARYSSTRELLQAIETEPHAEERAQAGSKPRWWWEFHQAVTALVYWLMVIPAWGARELLGAGVGRAFFIVTLASVIVAANLRLHLWFTSRFYPDELRWVRRRARRWIAVADAVFAAALVSVGLLIGDERSPLSLLLISFGIGAAVAFLLIEPVTTRAAFKASGATPR